MLSLELVLNEQIGAISLPTLCGRYQTSWAWRLDDAPRRQGDSSDGRCWELEHAEVRERSANNFCQLLEASQILNESQGQRALVGQVHFAYRRVCIYPRPQVRHELSDVRSIGLVQLCA